MKSVIFAIFALAMFSGCTKTGTSAAACGAAKGAGSIVSAAIGSQLACKNLDALKADVDAQIAKTKICQDSAQSTTGDIICPIVTEALMGSAIAQIPAAWECSGGVPADKLKALVGDACKKAF